MYSKLQPLTRQQMHTSFDHHSVLLEQTIHWLCPPKNEQRSYHYIDCTLGGAGHALRILSSNEDNHLIGIDRDPQAIKVAKERLQIFAPRFTLHHGTFAEILPGIEPNSQDGILMDLGLVLVGQAILSLLYLQEVP